VVGLSVIALLVAVAILLVFCATSDQAAMATVKRRMHAALFEIRLFNDDVRAILRALLEMLLQNVTYLRLSLVPILWMVGPLLLLLVQLQFYYGYDGLAPGAHAVVKVRLDETATPVSKGVTPAISLDAPRGLRVETPLVWVASEREAAWRIGADEPGEYQLIVTLAGRSVSKEVRVSDEVGWRTPERLETGFVNQLLYPVEPPIAIDVPIDSIHVTYPEREMSLLGWKTHWMIAFFLLTMMFAIALKKRVGVVF
jgi:hypothetical protein